MAWRTMRDQYYDGNLNNRDWDRIREKYEEKAARATDARVYAAVLSLMLGELNGSHLGFRSYERSWRPEDSWREETAHLGLRFDPAFEGPGLKVRDVIPESPAFQNKSRIEPGEVVLEVDGRPVQAGTDLTEVLNGPMDRDVRLIVRNGEGENREVILRPISFGHARGLLRREWIDDCRRRVSEASDDTLGYLYVRSMDWPSFLEFEREIYAEGAGKEGLIIDVRDNGGGFTTDHLLTVLCQPAHALTVPRGGGAGYPQDRRVYASWDKPIAVLCNQNSYSNAEIFSHAIKTLKRGKVVGVPTAGCVISTGSKRIMDLGRIRLPFRGWFLLENGEDMELNGAVPDHVLWPEPGELPAGRDRQLEKAVEVLLEDVAAQTKTPEPRYRHAKPE
jgi:tricorn protease